MFGLYELCFLYFVNSWWGMKILLKIFVFLLGFNRELMVLLLNVFMLVMRDFFW